MRRVACQPDVPRGARVSEAGVPVVVHCEGEGARITKRLQSGYHD